MKVFSLAAGLLFMGTSTLAYPIDCAILLCLAGGFPPSVECSAAKAEFIRRITPFPIEPPLQIWNCPLYASAPVASPTARLYDAAFKFEAFPISPEVTLTDHFWATRPADQSFGGSFIFPTQSYPSGDISDPVFDFVRSVKVWHFDYRQHEENDTNCVREDASRIGGYDLNGAFHWEPRDLYQDAGRADPFWGAPDEASIHSEAPGSCEDFRYRAVSVSWQNYFGKRGFHEVRY